MLELRNLLIRIITLNLAKIGSVVKENENAHRLMDGHDNPIMLSLSAYINMHKRIVKIPLLSLPVKHLQKTIYGVLHHYEGPTRDWLFYFVLKIVAKEMLKSKTFKFCLSNKDLKSK